MVLLIHAEGKDVELFALLPLSGSLSTRGIAQRLAVQQALQEAYNVSGVSLRVIDSQVI